MKTFLVKFLSVSAFGLFLIWNTVAQTAVTDYPYTADFGTVASPGADNAQWKFKSFDGADDYALADATEWSFSALSNDSLAVRFLDANAAEAYPAAFSPVFHFDKASKTSYTLKVTYNVPAAPVRHLVVRLHTVDASGEPYYVYVHASPALYRDAAEIKDNAGNVRSVLLQNHGGVPRVGVSEYTYFITSDLIPESGDYRISFILSYPPSKSIRSNEALYIKSLNVTKSVGSDLAAGQIISPYTDPQAGTQPFSAFIINRGGGTVSDVTACYQVDGAAPVRQIFSNVDIAPNRICRITFTQKPDLQDGNHILKFWVDNEDDLDRSNDTVSCLVKAGRSAMATFPANYDFTEENLYGWTMHSDSFYAQPAWRFVKEYNKFYPYVSTDKPGGAANNDYLSSPVFSFERGKMYRIEFTYKAVLASDEAMGNKSMALYMCGNAGRDALVSKELVWKQDRFEDRGERRMVVYYRAKDNDSRALAFHANGPASDGGLRLQKVSVSLADTNQLEYFFDFDGNSGEDPQYLVTRNLDFVDYDGNLSDAGNPGNWALYGNSGFNSQYSARSIGMRGQTNDWMVFKPFYLEAGKTYYLNFRTRMSATFNGFLEYYVQNDGPRYDLAYEAQTGIKGKKTVSGTTYDTVRRVFTVSESGYYLLSIRNITVAPEQTDLERLQNYTVYVDNVSLGERERHSVQAMYATVPYEARLGQEAILSVTVRNFSWGTVDASKVMCCYQVDAGEIFREHPVADILTQVNTSHTFSQSASFSKDKDQAVKFWVEMEGSDEKQDTVTVKVSKIKAKNLPFVEKFSGTSMEEWQSYPASRRQWQMQFGTETAHSGEWAAKYTPASSGDGLDFLVSPLLNVESNKTYRVSFFSRGDGNGLDSLVLYYAYNRYDNTGFLYQLTLFNRQVNYSSEYEFYQAYVRFPDSGAVFLGLGTIHCGGEMNSIYIDDFVLVDSLQTTFTDYMISDLVVSGNMSECDTMAIGRLSFKITAGGFSMPETIRAYIRYDDMPVQDVSFQKEMIVNEETVLSFPMPIFSGGDHRVKAWIALSDELDRTDDTVSARFKVQSPQAIPFHDGDIHVVGSPRMSSCFELDTVGTYVLRYRYDATNANGASMRLNLLTYGNNRIVNAREVDAQSNMSGTKVIEKEIEITALGVYAFGIECSGLPAGGVFRIDSIRLEKKQAGDSTAVRTFASNEFRMQPNPATDYVDFTVPVQAEHLDIFDMQGRVCRHFVLRKQRTLRVSLQGLKPGVYMVRVAGNNQTATLKLIKR